MLVIFILLFSFIFFDSYGQDQRIVTFKIQLAALPQAPKPASKIFADFPKAESIDLKDGMIRVYTGHFETYQEAKFELDSVKHKGYPTAYIVGFHQNKRISVDEAMEIIYGD